MNVSEIMNQVLLSISNDNPTTAIEVIQVYNQAYNRLDPEDKTLDNFLIAWYKPILAEMFIAAEEVLDEH